MDAIYARQRHIYDLTRKYYLLGRDRLIRRLDVPAGGTVLEIGCGTSRNLIAIARQYPAARLYGLDISAEMLATARANIAAAGLADRIVVRQADATRFDPGILFGVMAYDRVVFSYTLSMIPDWKSALRQGVAVTGGALHIVDFGQFERLPAWFGFGMRRWLAKFDVEPRAELFDFLRSLDPAFACDRIHRGYAWSATLSR